MNFKSVLGGGTLALASAVILPTAAYAADAVHADDFQTYDLGEVEVVGQRAEEPQTQPVTEPVTESYAGGQVARKSQLGVLGERDFMETPFNVLSFTEEHIQNRQAQTIQDLIADDPAVQESSGSSASNMWTVRGMELQGGDIAFNGLYNIAPNYTNSLNAVERVDILKGPGALLYGMAPNGGVGGSINLVPKRAKDEPIRRFTLSYGNGSQFGQSVDVGERFGKNKEYGVRINLTHRNGSTTFDREKQETTGAAIALDMRRNKWRASLDAGYLHREFKNETTSLRMSNAMVAAYGSIPKSPSSKLNLGEDGTFLDAKERYALLRADYDFDENWSAYAAAGLRHSEQDYTYNVFRLTGTDGTARVINYAFPRESRANTQEIGTKGKFQTGDLAHEMTVAYNRTHWTAYTNTKTLNAYNTNLYNIVWQGVQGYTGLSLPKTGESTLSGLAITDVITVPNERWQFILGARYQKIKTESFSRTTGLRSASYNEAAWSPAYAILFKATPKISLYATYMQGLQEGGTADRWSLNAGEVFAPIKTKSTEAGVKFDLGKFATALSIYELQKPTTIDDYVTSSTYYQRQVDYTSRGLEISFFGEPRTGTRVLGGLTWIDARYGQENYNGNTLEGVANKKFVMSVEQDVHGVPGLSVSTRFLYTGSAYYDPNNVLRVAPWFRMDLGTRYSFHMGTMPVTVRLDVNNVLDRRYWQATGGGYRVNLGEHRNFMLSVTADF